MNYKLINEKLGIYSCKVSDLSKEQVKECAPISNLTVLAMQDGTIILNKDHKKYEEYKDFVCSYMELSLSDREQLKKELPFNSFTTCVDILDQAINAAAIILNNKMVLHRGFI